MEKYKSAKAFDNVPLIELRNGFSKFPSPDVLFYSRVLGKKIISNEVQWKRWERTKKIADHFAFFEFYYSTESEKEILNEVQDSFDYILIARTEDLVNDYKQVCYEFESKSKFSRFCKIANIEEMLSIYKSYFLIEDVGNIAA